MERHRKLAAGNWKMNGLSDHLGEIAALIGSHGDATCEILICPPATLVAPMAAHAGSRIAVGGQDCHAEANGAHTGDISAEMLRDAGATYVITGHSERRADHGESDEAVRAKTEAGWKAGLVVILCIGETLDQREAGETLSVIDGQLAGSVPEGATGDNLVIAYEPVWAIGTGKVPSVEQIAEVHDHIRKTLSERFGTGTADAVRLLYGGSVKPGNASEIFAVDNVDGALVGGASLKADDFGGIISALEG
ncbi:triose-phosphate isomerase [Palleronia sp. LCG004]|uniref:triose-phosphate isomerase n=1 Tax=Palleronia sp. LCG004 TaxID=3079304 RepID=UPI002942B2EB|nr:triose-phosphate isomerase [Palleronia sp. LCG004]WOI55172.1 triose-phosphate isomerase [Palleronia sp. LCG004]